MNWSIIGTSIAVVGALFIFWRISRARRISLHRLIEKSLPTSEQITPFIKHPVPDGQERMATQAERDDVDGMIERSNASARTKRAS